MPEPELRCRPTAWYALLRPWRRLVACFAMSGAFAAMGAVWPAVLYWAGPARWVCLAVAVGVVVWFEIDRRMRRYEIVDGRARAEIGVLRRLTVEAPMQRLQNVWMLRGIRERLVGAGTIGLATAGEDGAEVVWPWAPNAKALFERIKQMAPDAAASTDDARRMPVIGLAGGIGAGKSAAARALASLGCAVSDSDTEAHAVLQEPDVKAQLREWWGDEVFAPDGSVDRKAVGRVVFDDAAARARLEGLVHPRLHARRSALREKAAGDGARAMVIDAPLLFEAGVDRECDAVIFIDAPREERLARVAETRGWDGEELARRESAQAPVEEKKSRSDYVVLNTRDEAALGRVIAEVLGQIERTRPTKRAR